MGAFLVSAFSLAFAFLAQYGFDLEPCILCLYQRIPFFMVMGLSALALARPDWFKPLMIAAALLFLGNACLAFYHVGVEQHWWVAATGCSAGASDIQTFNPDEFLASLQKKQPKACDQVDWTFLGISMATYNVFYCLVLGALMLTVLRLINQKSGATA